MSLSEAVLVGFFIWLVKELTYAINRLATKDKGE